MWVSGLRLVWSKILGYLNFLGWIKSFIACWYGSGCFEFWLLVQDWFNQNSVLLSESNSGSKLVVGLFWLLFLHFVFS